MTNNTASTGLNNFNHGMLISDGFIGAAALLWLILLISPVSAWAMCAFEQETVAVTIKVASCGNLGVRGVIVAGLNQKDHSGNPSEEQIFKLTEKSGVGCSDFKIGEQAEILVRRECCDMIGHECFFGWIVPKVD